MASRGEVEEIVDWEGPGLRKAGHIPPYTDEQKEEWIRCAQDPIYFIEKYWKITHPDRGLILFPLRPFQKEAIKAYVEHRMIAMLCSRQIGKALCLSTPILTPSGFKEMRDIHPGDIVYGADGRETRVTFESEIHQNRNCFKVTFDNGETVVADEEHLWKIGILKSRRIPGAYNKGPGVKKCEIYPDYQVLTTGEIVGLLNSRKAIGQSVFVDVASPLEMESKEHAIDPYLLGLWLGDGYSKSGKLIGELEDVSHYQQRLSRYTFSDNNYRRNWNLRVVRIEGLYEELKKLNLINNKHIPADYMLGSFQQRLALVQGLMDTDGSITAKGSGEFYTKNLDLAQQFQTLMASLGVKSKIRGRVVSSISGREISPRTYYTVRFLTSLPVATLPRKAERIRSHIEGVDSKRHYIKSIEKVESVPVKCIQVDNEDHLFLCGKSLIPTHNTSVTAAFIGWFINFHPNVSVGVLADKQETAIEIHDRLKLGYENLPHWLKHGYTKWNVKSIKLENGSSVQVSATTINAGRGRSFSIVFLDEFAAVKRTVAEKFKASIIPTIAAGTETKLFVTSTPQGKNHFFKIVKEAEEGNNWHLIKADYRADPARDNQQWVETQVKELGLDMFRQEHLCDFIGSTQTLIHPDKLRELIARRPTSTIPLNIYNQPEEGRQYVMICDCGEGVGLDYSAIQVIDVSEKNYKQVASYRDNKIKPHELALFIKQVGELYNQALVFIEDASTGPLVAEGLHAAEYRNILTLEKIKGKEQHKVLIGRNGKGRFGGKTTLPVKLLGCTELKRLIESDGLIINDRATIDELESYSRQGAVYAAEDGNNDDLVTALMLFGWLHTLREFRLMLDNAVLSEDSVRAKAETYQILNFMQKLNGVEQFEAHGMLWKKSS